MLAHLRDKHSVTKDNYSQYLDEHKEVRLLLNLKIVIQQQVTGSLGHWVIGYLDFISQNAIKPKLPIITITQHHHVHPKDKNY